MIWFILGILPFIAPVAVGMIKEPKLMGMFVWAYLALAVFIGFALLALYGAWTMDWIEHCGDFWASCS